MSSEPSSAKEPNRIMTAMPLESGRKIVAIASISLRSAVKSRLFVTLAVALLFAVLGLPLAIKGDGTAVGQVRILLCYTLVLAAFILGAATLWAACSSVSEDIENKQIRLVAVKPVSRAQIWLGKWLGLLALNAALVSFVGLVVYAQLFRQMRVTAQDDEARHRITEEVLTPRQIVLPRLEPLEQEIDRRLEASGWPPAHQPRRREDLRMQIQAERSAIEAGTTREWIFDLPAERDGDRSARLRFRGFSAAWGNSPVSGTWSVGTIAAPDRHTSRMADLREGPAGFCFDLAADERGPLVVHFANDDAPESGTFILDPESGLQLLLAAGSFEMNLLRAMTLLFGYMALLAALGVTAGTLFSFPVATFTATGLIAISLTAHYFAVSDSSQPPPGQHESSEDGPLALVLRQATEQLSKGVGKAVSPLMQYEPFEELADGTLISWSRTGRAVLVLIVLYPGVLCLAGSWALARRELALPG